MLTKNFPSMYKALKIIVDASNNYNDKLNERCNNLIRDLSGQMPRVYRGAITCSAGFASTDGITFPAETNCCILAIGSGNTPATSDDYKLENEITKGFEVISQTTGYSNKFSSSYATITRVIKNTGTEPLKINEIGLKVQGYWPNRAEGTQFLVAREALKEQCVISGGKALLYNHFVRGIADFARNITALGSRLEVA